MTFITPNLTEYLEKSHCLLVENIPVSPDYDNVWCWKLLMNTKKKDYEPEFEYKHDTNDTKKSLWKLYMILLI